MRGFVAGISTTLFHLSSFSLLLGADPSHGIIARLNLPTNWKLCTCVTFCPIFENNLGMKQIVRSKEPPFFGNGVWHILNLRGEGQARPTCTQSLVDNQSARPGRGLDFCRQSMHASPSLSATAGVHSVASQAVTGERLHLLPSTHARAGQPRDSGCRATWRRPPASG